MSGITDTNTYTVGRESEYRIFWMDCPGCGGAGYELEYGRPTPLVCVECEGTGGWWVPVTERQEER